MVGDKTLFKWPPSANVGIRGRASPQPKKVIATSKCCGDFSFSFFNVDRGDLFSAEPNLWRLQRAADRADQKRGRNLILRPSSRSWFSSLPRVRARRPCQGFQADRAKQAAAYAAANGTSPRQHLNNFTMPKWPPVSLSSKGCLPWRPRLPAALPHLRYHPHGVSASNRVTCLTSR
jgi:hypothetical protein